MLTKANTPPRWKRLYFWKALAGLAIILFALVLPNVRALAGDETLRRFLGVVGLIVIVSATADRRAAGKKDALDRETSEDDTK
jgi:hypothetical protein